MARDIARATYKNKRLNENIKKQWKSGAVGSVPQTKGDNIGRFMFENFNSLSLWKSQDKINQLNALLKTYDIDCALGAELQVQWGKVDRDLRLDRVLWPGTDKRAIAGYNMCMRTSVDVSTEELQPLPLAASLNSSWQWARIRMGWEDVLGFSCRLVVSLPGSSQATFPAVFQHTKIRSSVQPASPLLPPAWRPPMPQDNFH
jgi:hypothetical protein